jgi:hypothetical protein
MLTLEEISKKLEDRNLRAVSEKTGIDYNRLWRASKWPRFKVYADVASILSDYFESEEK